MTENINIPVTDTTVVQVILDLAQARCRSRLLTVEDILTACSEAERAFDGLGLTQKNRIGIQIEASSSEKHFAASYRGIPRATFARMRRTRDGWRLTAAGRGINRNMKSSWLATHLPNDDTLARAGARVLRRGTNGRPRL
ncbi:hypothetical protein [Microbacterium sp.]|uniref:hypothetical protein n=1 Tax=Microbacterium sp. TaxID=51671 RepID=UPI002735BC61|nr:hypothetical protein [Microbacterium sp.]MDP3951888.1 hypothetical protein [Microbacterium sp.]